MTICGSLLMVVLDGERQSAACHPAWRGAAGLHVLGNQAAREGRWCEVRIWHAPGWVAISRTLIPLQECPGHGQVCPSSKMAWAVQQELVGQFLFEGVSGHLQGVTEITLGISAVALPVPHSHVDGDGRLRPQPMLLAKEKACGVAAGISDVTSGGQG